MYTYCPFCGTIVYLENIQSYVYCGTCNKWLYVSRFLLSEWKGTQVGCSTISTGGVSVSTNK